MNIPYHTRQNLKRIGLIALVILVAVLLVGIFWFIWLERFVVYTRQDGAILDMSLSETFPEGQSPKAPELPDVPIYYNEGENALNASRELTQIVGYYATADDLRGSVDVVLSQVQSLPAGTPVMLDVKNPKGGFFYSSTITATRDRNIDAEAMDGLIKYLKDANMYAIARLPALRNYEYGLNHTSDGLPTSGGYLWADSGYCYWLNPSSQGTLTHLIQIVTELKDLGFDEVVFEEFRFPDTDKIVFKADKKAAIANAAATLVSTCSTENFTISFEGPASFPLPEGRCRLYLQGVSAANAESTAASFGFEDPALRLVFLTEVHDTRFDICSVLRPLEAAH